MSCLNKCKRDLWNELHWLQEVALNVMHRLEMSCIECNELHWCNAMSGIECNDELHWLGMSWSVWNELPLMQWVTLNAMSCNECKSCFGNGNEFYWIKWIECNELHWLGLSCTECKSCFGMSCTECKSCFRNEFHWIQWIALEWVALSAWVALEISCIECNELQWVL